MITLITLIGAPIAAPAQARATVAASADGARADVQARYEGCLADLDAGLHASAAECLGEVYRDLVAIDPNTRADLYYVLADAVTARKAAAAADPIHLCRAKDLVDDYLERERETNLLRFKRKVVALQGELGDAVAGARAAAGRDVCEAPPPVSEPTPSEAPAEGEAASGEAATGAAPKPATATKSPKTTTKPKVEASASPARSRRRLGLEASTSLMDTGFITTIIGGGVTGLGAALYTAQRECAAGPPVCPEATPAAVRHAGLALMSIGGAALFVGIVLRWADQRRLRRLKPRVGTALMPISIAF